MITLYQLPTGPELPVSVSSYCSKLELYLRLTDRAYTTAPGNMQRSPTKTVPYVKWPDGSIQGDSGDIIKRLEAEGPSLNAGLSPEDKARGDHAEHLAQDVLYFSGLYTNFVDPEGWALQLPGLKKALPFLLRPVLPGIIRSSQIKKCAANGFADASGHTAAVAAIREISDILGDGPFLLGDKPRVADCAAWANLLMISVCSLSTPPREAARADKRVQAYLDRVAAHVKLSLPRR